MMEDVWHMGYLMWLSPDAALTWSSLVFWKFEHLPGYCTALNAKSPPSERQSLAHSEPSCFVFSPAGVKPVIVCECTRCLGLEWVEDHRTEAPAVWCDPLV